MGSDRDWTDEAVRRVEADAGGLDLAPYTATLARFDATGEWAPPA